MKEQTPQLKALLDAAKRAWADESCAAAVAEQLYKAIQAIDPSWQPIVWKDVSSNPNININQPYPKGRWS